VYQFGCNCTGTEYGENQFDLLDSAMLSWRCGCWIESYSAAPHKIEKFVERYDTAILDAHSALHGEGCIIRRNEIYYFPPTA